MTNNADSACQCASGEKNFTVDLSLLEPILEQYRGARGSLIPVLQSAQKTYGYLPETALEEISRALRVPLSQIHGVVTFYAQFYLTPRGRHTIKSCQGTACHVRGAKNVLQALEDQLKVKPGETTEDMNFSLETVACIGTCFLAPAVMIDHDYFGEMEPKKVRKMLNQYKSK